MTCYGVLGQAILFHVVNVCKLSSTKPYLHSIRGLLVLTIYLTPAFQDSFLTLNSVLICFSVLLRVCWELFVPISVLCLSLKKKKVMAIQELTQAFPDKKWKYEELDRVFFYSLPCLPSNSMCSSLSTRGLSPCSSSSQRLYLPTPLFSRAGPGTDEVPDEGRDQRLISKETCRFLCDNSMFLELGTRIPQQSEGIVGH